MKRDEAIEFVEQLAGATLAGLADDLIDLAEDMRAAEPRVTAQRVAAVIEGHARAAQVAILREMADDWANGSYEHRWASSQLRRRANELDQS